MKEQGDQGNIPPTPSLSSLKFSAGIFLRMEYYSWKHLILVKCIQHVVHGGLERFHKLYSAPYPISPLLPCKNPRATFCDCRFDYRLLANTVRSVTSSRDRHAEGRKARVSVMQSEWVGMQTQWSAFIHSFIWLCLLAAMNVVATNVGTED